MPQLDTFELPQIVQLEQSLQQPVMVLACSSLDADLLPALYNTLSTVPQSNQVSILLYGHGGEINVARRVALLLYEKFQRVDFIIPYYCQSSFTTLALSGYRLYTGPMSSFSPIDTHLEISADEQGSPSALASEDIRLFPSMAQEWFSVNSTQDADALFASVTSHIFPTTLTSLYRSIKEQQQIAHELVALNESITDQQIRDNIVKQLMFGYHSHSYALTGKDMSDLGLTVAADDDLFKLAWNAVCRITSIIGGQARKSPEDPRNDCLIMTAKTMCIRQHSPNAYRPCWFEKEL